ncbi:terminase small subunit [Psychromicrobium lacuslunae]|uniref:terminase small subunit n=1 Tax=Psychromicrobium lacuslunae TaxID=1618207 RepID=UPI000AFAEFF7|nr:hypothetical protein [Psychromicrobium lacuslunae]
MSVFESCVKAIEAAPHVDRDGVDAAAVEALLSLARKIDAWDVIVGWAFEDAAESGDRPKVPANDNTSLPTFLRYCEALGLTPGSRKALTGDKAVEVDPVDELKQKRKAKAKAG